MTKIPGNANESLRAKSGFVASAGVFAAAPQGADDPQPALGKMFFTERMMRNMDKNKDGMVSRQEFLDYMGAQFDKMDAKKKGMLNKSEFMDSKMMANTFGYTGD